MRVTTRISMFEISVVFSKQYIFEKKKITVQLMSDTIPVEMMTNIYLMRFRNKDQQIL